LFLDEKCNKQTTNNEIKFETNLIKDDIIHGSEINICSPMNMNQEITPKMFVNNFIGLPAHPQNEVTKAKKINQTSKIKVEPTIDDLKQLTPYDALTLDKTPFFQMVSDALIDEHALICLLFKKSLLDSAWQRVMNFFLNMHLIFAINALLFSDDYIDSRSDVDASVTVNQYFLLIRIPFGIR
jgi:hypothetical protein